MLTLKQLKKDLQFNRELSGLVDVLKDIASAQFRHLQTKREYFIRFTRSLEDFFETVDVLNSEHPFLRQENSLLSSGIVMITSDEGFLGELNSQVINAGLIQRKSNDSLIVLGERGANFLEDLKEPFLYFPGISEDIRYAQAQSLRDYLIQQYLKKKFTKVTMVYPKFISFALREITVEQLLPYTPQVGSGSRDSFLVEHRTANTEQRTPQPDTIIEPSEERMVDYLIRIWMAQKIYDIFWESKLSEWASRVFHLEESSQVVSQLNKQLQFFYFRTLHGLSDKNIREIFASMITEKRTQ